MGGMHMVKFLTQHTNHKNFFSELQEGEIFMYSYTDYTWEEVIKIAEESKVKLEYIKKGTEDYRKYGECSARIVNIKGKVFEFKIGSEEVVKIEARDEESARTKLIDYLFDENYIVLNKKSAS
jgi:arginine deiminase